MNTNFPDSDLSRHLARKADQFDRLGGSPLELGQVLDRAGEIKRGRRMRATMVMAAVALAVAVPTALIATSGSELDKPVTPAKQVKVDTSPITLDGLKQGDAPEVGYVIDDKLIDGGDTVALDSRGGQVNEVAPMVGGYLVSIATGGDVIARFVDGNGKAAPEEWPISGGIAVSDDRRLAAFVEPDGTPIVVQDSGARSYELATVPRGTGFQIVGVGGPDCGRQAAEPGCVAWVESRGEKPEIWESTSSGDATPVWPEFRSVTAIADGSLVAGITQVKDDLTTCSAVAGFAQSRPRWTMCGRSPLAFSPDRSLLLAQPDGDGAGSSGLAVYDAEDGTLRLELQTRDDAFITRMIWEDNEHLLAVVGEGTQAAILRFGLDGSREYAVPPTATEPYETPFVLPSR